jgi:hypothetical protein
MRQRQATILYNGAEERREGKEGREKEGREKEGRE